MILSSRRLVPAALLGLLSVYGMAQGHSGLRVGEWNVTNYLPTSATQAQVNARNAAFATSLYGSFQGRSFAPDVLTGQEFLGSTSIDRFLAMLNTAAGSPGDWAAAPYVNNTNGAATSNNGSNAFFYRTSKVTLTGQVEIAGDPRNTMRYDMRLKGYQNTTNAPVISMYSDHFKSGSATDDQARRQTQAANIRTNAATINDGRSILFGGDMNIQSSSQTAYQTMTVNGPFFDPIASPGNWNNNSAFKFIHTQDPVGTGGMDDRHDQILINSTLRDGKGIEYIGNSNVAYSTTRWDDPNHSYRCWGNDGTTYGGQISVNGNTMVGDVIAQALRNSVGTNDVATVTGGHLPVFLDLRTAGEIGSSTDVLDFGDVALGSSQFRSLSLFNSVDDALYGIDGVQGLSYSLLASAGFSAPSGTFADLAGGTMNTHSIGIDTTIPGMRTGTLTVTDISGVTRTVTLRANVGAVPEPATFAALGLGVAAMLRRRKRA